LFVPNVAVNLDGQHFRAGELIRYDGAAYASAFDPAANGVPRGVEIDAVSELGGDLLLSFDSSVDLGGTFAADEDLVRFDNPGFSSQFDLSGLGAAGSLDVDAAHYAPAALRLFVSFDRGDEIDGVTFRGQDVLVLDASEGTWTLDYDASSASGGWARAGLDAAWIGPAVEPGQLQWSQPAVSVPEGAGQVTLKITRTDGTDGIVAVNFETVADTATAGDDFGPTNGNIAIDDGVDSYELDVTIADDGIEEVSEQFFVDLTGVTLGGATLGSQTRVTVTIVDDDDPDLVFANGFEPLP
jgi:hypothetical protein